MKGWMNRAQSGVEISACGATAQCSDYYAAGLLIKKYVCNINIQTKLVVRIKVFFMYWVIIDMTMTVARTAGKRGKKGGGESNGLYKLLK